VLLEELEEMTLEEAIPKEEFSSSLSSSSSVLDSRLLLFPEMGAEGSSKSS